MSKYKIIYDREVCIGAFACSAVAPDFWLYNEDGKADLKAAKYNAQTKCWELIVDGEQDFDDNQAAAEACPVYAIKVEKMPDVPDEHHDFGDWKSQKE